MKGNEHAQHEMTYKPLALMAIVSFFVMYALMYAMVDRFENVLLNVNQFYMAGLMASPMIVIEILVMRMMYQNKKHNAIIIAASLLVTLGFFLAIRTQLA